MLLSTLKLQSSDCFLWAVLELVVRSSEHGFVQLMRPMGAISIPHASLVMGRSHRSCYRQGKLQDETDIQPDMESLLGVTGGQGWTGMSGTASAAVQKVQRRTATTPCPGTWIPSLSSQCAIPPSLPGGMSWALQPGRWDSAHLLLCLLVFAWSWV